MFDGCVLIPQRLPSVLQQDSGTELRPEAENLHEESDQSAKEAAPQQPSSRWARSTADVTWWWVTRPFAVDR